MGLCVVGVCLLLCCERDISHDPTHPHKQNAQVLETQYAVRGELYLRAEELRKEGKEIIFTNVGNPHALGAKPLTYIRQVGVEMKYTVCIWV